jgi:hypothetical protein
MIILRYVTPPLTPPTWGGEIEKNQAKVNDIDAFVVAHRIVELMMS